MQTTEQQLSIQAQILRFEGDCAIMQNGHGEFKWPISSLPSQVQMGQIITLTVKQDQEVDKLATMRKLLEELIN